LKILLIAPSKLAANAKNNWSSPHLGLFRLAHWIERETGAVVTVHDPGLRGNPRAEDFAGYDFIGFSPLDETLAEDIRLMILAKNANPAATLVCGGVEATLNYQTILEKTQIEWVVTGYGESAFVEIIRGEASRTAGTIHRVFSEVISESDLWAYYQSLDFSRMGYMDYWQQTESMYDEPDFDNTRTIRLITSSHCNRGCAFCSATQWQKYATGKMSPTAMLNSEQLISLVSRIQKEVPEVQSIFFCEDDFCQSRSRAEEFCAWSEGSNLRYLVQTHLSRVDESLIRTFGQGRVRLMTLGIENASESVLRSFAKPQDLSRVPEIIRQCVSVGVVPYLLIILFAPSSTIEDLVVNCKTLREWIDLGADISIEPFTMPYRGAILWESLHAFEYDVVRVTPTVNLKRALKIVPDDPDVQEILRRFLEERAAWQKNHAITHLFKAVSGPILLGLLENVLRERGLY
jgi:radical SAM superfamily enzyme YgiQ (UPF0313 family)